METNRRPQTIKGFILIFLGIALLFPQFISWPVFRVVLAILLILTGLGLLRK